ncbi:hypothetical protein FC093_04210 [Ilyomonas limi]|uniref:Uncharacterized protein n=1 Tax=Ilyomonas limi TaxID=2575867 RepID=A0A4U3L6N6_9BACT|nr:AsmA-like C-terminal region-containing protein [Ilyomonas limi]TKK70905.1 hypothetical protein FC093_04210 [Ilyomonas limi]
MREKQKKILEKILWVLGALAIVLAVALMIFQVYINHHKQAFVTLVNNKLNEAVAGTATIKDVTINVWRYFPNVDVAVNDIVIKDSVYNKALLQAKYVSTRINMIMLISKNVNVHNLFVEDGIIHLFTDKNGYSNTYLFKKKNKKSATGKAPVIDEVELKNVGFVTENAIKDKWFGVSFRYVHAGLDYADSIINISLETNALIKGLGFNLQKGYFLKDKTVKADWALTFNNHSKQLSFKETPVKIGPSNFILKGDFFLTDTLTAHFRLLAKASNINYKDAASLLTPNISKKVNLVELTRPLNLTATIEGPMSFRTIPLINVEWVVARNQLVTPVLTLDECSFTGTFTNERNKQYPRTDDNSEIALNKLSAKWGGLLLAANTPTVVTNLVHPVLQFDFSSATTLTALDEKLNLATLHFTKGTAELNVQYNGPLGTDPALLEYLSGNLKIKNGAVVYEPRNLTFNNCNGEVVFSQSDLLVHNLQCDLNTNHFKVDIAGQNVNILASSTKLPGAASIICTVYTPDLDLADFKTLFAARRAVVRRKSKNGVAKPAVQIDNILENGTLNLVLQADAVHLKHFTASNVQARIAFEKNDMDIQKVSLQHAGGSVKMDATVHQTSNNYNTATANLNLSNINVEKLFYAFDDFGMKSLNATNLRGVLNTTANLKLGIDEKGNLIKNSMLGNLQFSLKKGALVGFKPLEDIQKFIFKNRDFSHIEFAELKDNLQIKGDEVYIPRMEVETNVLTLFIEGIYSFGNNTDISIQVPLSNLKSRGDDYVVKNRGANRKVGASIYLRAKGKDDGNVKIGLDLFNKMRGNNYKKQFKDDTGEK